MTPEACGLPTLPCKAKQPLWLAAHEPSAAFREMSQEER